MRHGGEERVQRDAGSGRAGHAGILVSAGTAGG